MRADKLSGFLANRPATADRLVCVTYALDGSEVDLACWLVTELPAEPGALAELARETCQDHADDNGKGRYSFLWCVKLEGEDRPRVIRRRAFIFEPGMESNAREAQHEAGQAWDPNAPSVGLIFGQVVRHAENMHKLYVQSLSSVVVAQRDIITQLSQQNTELLRRVRTLQGRVIEVEGDGGAKAAQEGVEELARAQAIEKVGDFVVQHLGPLIIERVASAAGMNGKGATPQ